MSAIALHAAATRLMKSSRSRDGRDWVSIGRRFASSVVAVALFYVLYWLSCVLLSTDRLHLEPLHKAAMMRSSL